VTFKESRGTGVAKSSLLTIFLNCTIIINLHQNNYKGLKVTLHEQKHTRRIRNWVTLLWPW